MNFSGFSCDQKKKVCHQCVCVWRGRPDAEVDDNAESLMLSGRRIASVYTLTHRCCGNRTNCSLFLFILFRGCCSKIKKNKKCVLSSDTRRQKTAVRYISKQAVGFHKHPDHPAEAILQARLKPELEHPFHQHTSALPVDGKRRRPHAAVNLSQLVEIK